MSDEVMKADDAAPDYRKAMLYHSDRADEFMAQRDEALRALAAEREKVARLVEARGPLAEITAERERQKSVEGWTHEHDDRHIHGELSRAAATYAWASTCDTVDRGDGAPTIWPWSRDWWKPKDRRRDLIRAAALIVAEIERLDRAALASVQDGAQEGER